MVESFYECVLSQMNSFIGNNSFQLMARWSRTPNNFVKKDETFFLQNEKIKKWIRYCKRDSASFSLHDA